MSDTPSTDTDSPEFRARAETRRRTWTVTIHHDFASMKAAEYRYWATQPAHAALAMVSELSAEGYAMKTDVQ